MEMRFFLSLATVFLLASFIPFSVISYLRWQLPDKQKRFLDIMEKCKWRNSTREPAWVPYSLLVEIGGALDANSGNRDYLLEKARKAARLDYILPVLFATVITLMGSTTMIFGPILIDGAFKDVYLLLGGPFVNAEGVPIGDICTRKLSGCAEKAKTLQYLQVSTFAFVGAYIWALTHIMRRLNVIDLDANAYYSVGIRIILSNFLAIVLFMGLHPSVSKHFPQWVPAIAFLIGWFPQRFFHFLREKVFTLLGLRQKEAKSLPLEMIQGAQLFQRTRLSEAGIDDAENLANANLLELLIRTPFNPRLLIDWISQAKLYVLFRDKIYTLREARVRTIFDLRSTMADEEAKKALFVVLDRLAQTQDAKKRGLKEVCKEELTVAYNACKEDKDILWLQSAQQCLLGLEKK